MGFSQFDLPRVALVCRYAFPDTEPCRYLEIPRVSLPALECFTQPSRVFWGKASLSWDWVSQITGSLGIAVSCLLGASQPCPLVPNHFGRVCHSWVVIKWMHLDKMLWALDQSLALFGSGPFRVSIKPVPLCELMGRRRNPVYSLYLHIFSGAELRGLRKPAHRKWKDAFLLKPFKNIIVRQMWSFG